MNKGVLFIGLIILLFLYIHQVLANKGLAIDILKTTADVKFN